MSSLKPIRLISTAALLAAVPLLSASAQTQAPSDSPAPPAIVRPDPTPMPPQATTPQAQKPAIPARPTDQSATAPARANPMVGLAIFSADGNKVSTVQSVVTGPDGKVSAIQFKTGGFLGFGGKLVSVPESKFTRAGENIQLGLTAEEVSKLPEAKEQS
jgi:PRC-barrel domain